jgi:RNA polymerase sigma-70 factor (ECF subfamily)
MQPAEFELVFKEYSNALFRHALFRVGNREKAFDLAQDTFIKAWGSVAKGETVRGWKPFLYRILNNLIIDYYRSKKNVSLDEIDERIEEHGGAVPQALQTGGLDDEVERFDLMISTRELMKAMEGLSPQDAALLTARCIDELETGEVATMLGISESAVYVRTHRALKVLKKLVADNSSNRQT